MLCIRAGVVSLLFPGWCSVVEVVVIVGIPFRIQRLTHSVQAVQLVEDVQLDDVLVSCAGDELGGVGQEACLRIWDLAYADWGVLANDIWGLLRLWLGLLRRGKVYIGRGLPRGRPFRWWGCRCLRGPCRDLWR